jgi:DNA-binding transcriptional LysR family regulator
MSINRLKIIDAISKHHSFANAAKVLNMTPSAVSHAVNKLEDELNLQLFVRNKRGATLTRNGERLIPYIHSILRNYEMLELEAEQIHGLISGTVRLATFNSVTISWLPQILKDFHGQYPNIEILIYQGSYDDIADWLTTDTVDLAFVVEGVAPENVDVIPLHKDKLVCVTPQNYIPPNKTYVTIEDISKMKLILQQHGYNKEVLDYFNRNHMAITTFFYVETSEAMIALVASDLGFCVLSEMISIPPNIEVNVFPIYPEDYRLICLATVRHQFPAPATMVLQKKILEFIDESRLKNL